MVLESSEVTKKYPFSSETLPKGSKTSVQASCRLPRRHLLLWLRVHFPHPQRSELSYSVMRQPVKSYIWFDGFLIMFQTLLVCRPVLELISCSEASALLRPLCWRRKAQQSRLSRHTQWSRSAVGSKSTCFYSALCNAVREILRKNEWKARVNILSKSRFLHRDANMPAEPFCPRYRWQK